MKFAIPEFLWLLLLAPLLGWLLWWAGRQRRKLAAAFVSARLTPTLIAGLSPVRRRVRAVGWVAALVFLVLAIARPQWGFQWEEVKQRGLDIIVAIDTSRSMLAEDIKPNRLERAKLAALDLARQARTDRIGLVAFSGGAFLQCPLTLDDEAFRQSLTLLDTEIIPQGGTAIAEAIEVACAAFTNAGESHKVLVLFTDGEDHEEGVTEAVQVAAKLGLKIYAVGMGTPEGEVLRIQDARGRSTPMRDEQGNSIHSRLNERLLNTVATTTGGLYRRLTGANTVEALYEGALSALPKTEHSARLVKQFQERYHWPLSLAILLLVMEILMADRTMKKAMPNQTRAAPAALLALALSLGGAATVRATSAGEAARHLEAGRNRAAIKAYEQMLIEKPNDPRLHYNLGIAAYRVKDYERAAREFGSATISPENLDLQASAFYNGGNTLYRLGEAATDFEEKKSQWQSATNQYLNALRLNKDDQDAQRNLDYVIRKLQELEQQQQQAQNEQQQNQQDNQDQQKQEQQQQDKEQQQADQQNQEQKQNPEQQQANQKEQEQQQQQQQASGQPKEQEDGQQQQASNGDQQGQDQTNANPTAAQSMAAIRMTPEQARQLLEAAKIEERVLPYTPPPEADPRKAKRPGKNW